VRRIGIGKRNGKKRKEEKRKKENGWWVKVEENGEMNDAIK